MPDDSLAFRKILVPLDGSPLAEQALPWASWIAQRTGSQLRLALVHQVPRALLDPAAAKMFTSIELATRKSERSYLRGVQSKLRESGSRLPSAVTLTGAVGPALVTSVRMSEPRDEICGRSVAALNHEADVVLRGGSTVRIRAVRPDDEPGLAAFLQGLSERSRVLRFFAAASDDTLGRAAARFSKVDDGSTFALVATAGTPERIVGHAMYAVTAADRAEVAFVIGDEWHDQGLGTLLLVQLAQIAFSRGVRLFEAVVLPENYQMLVMFRESGFPVRTHAAPGEIRVEFPTELSREAVEQFDRRE